MVVVMFLAIWATDVFAYYGGKRFGKRQLSTISPNKTIEGTVSGVIAAMISVAVVCYIPRPFICFGFGWRCDWVIWAVG